MESLIHYDKENIHPNIITALEPYQKDKEFDPEFIKSKSAAAAGLCSWVINIVKFFDVYCDVEPKRRALDEANAELLAARHKLCSVKNKVKTIITCHVFVKMGSSSRQLSYVLDYNAILRMKFEP